MIVLPFTAQYIAALNYLSKIDHPNVTLSGGFDEDGDFVVTNSNNMAILYLNHIATVGVNLEVAYVRDSSIYPVSPSASEDELRDTVDRAIRRMLEVQ